MMETESLPSLVGSGVYIGAPWCSARLGMLRVRRDAVDAKCERSHVYLQNVGIEAMIVLSDRWYTLQSHGIKCYGIDSRPLDGVPTVSDECRLCVENRRTACSSVLLNTRAMQTAHHALWDIILQIIRRLREEGTSSVLIMDKFNDGR